MQVLNFNVGNPRRHHGRGAFVVDVTPSDERGTDYPVIECSIVLSEEQLDPAVLSYCSSRYQLTLGQKSEAFARVRGFISKHDARIRELMQEREPWESN